MLALANSAAAQAGDTQAYRCGNSYSSQPCPGGTALDLADPRSDQQRRETLAASQRNAALARQLAAQRQADERSAAKLGPANVGPAAAPAKAASKPSNHPERRRHKAAKRVKQPLQQPAAASR